MQAFPDVPRIEYEGPESKNPLSFRWYNPDEEVEGRTMRDHFRFSVVYWHTFRGTGADPFGIGTAIRPWDDGSQTIANAQQRARVAFEFGEKLQTPFYAFHDRDVAPEGSDLAETNRHLDEVVAVYLVSGEDDLIVEVSVADTVSLQAVVVDEIASIPGVVDERTSLVFEHRRKTEIGPLTAD